MLDPRAYLDEFQSVVGRLDTAAVGRMSAVVFEAWKRGRTVFSCGNGGSAANASHFAADLTKLTVTAGHARRVRAVALTECGAAMTAIANDLSYDEIFAEQLRAFLQPGDVLLALSTSGASQNVLRAVEFASAGGATTLAISGRQGVALAGLAHEALLVDSTSVQQIEDATMVAAHLLCLQVRDRIAASVRKNGRTAGVTIAGDSPAESLQ